jgi:threonyl-tRNA synthetase
MVVGDKEIESSIVLPRIRKDMEVHAEHQALGINEFLKTVSNEARARVLKSSL